MEYQELHKDLNLNIFFDGFTNVYKNLNINIESFTEATSFIDKICLSHNFIGLKEEWKELSFEEAESFFISSLRFNIGFTKHENMSKEKARDFYIKLTENFNLQKCSFFSNWYNNPWIEGCDNSIGINTISDSTLDLALFIIDENKILFHFISFED